MPDKHLEPNMHEIFTVTWRETNGTIGGVLRTSCYRDAESYQQTKKAEGALVEIGQEIPTEPEPARFDVFGRLTDRSGYRR